MNKAKPTSESLKEDSEKVPSRREWLESAAIVTGLVTVVGIRALMQKEPQIEFQDGLTPEECAEFGLFIEEHRIRWEGNAVDFPSFNRSVRIERVREGKILMTVTQQPWNVDSLPHSYTYRFYKPMSPEN